MISIIQLSDIHFELTNNSFLEKKMKFLEAIQNYCLDVDQIFLVLSGDIAYSGLKGEYLIATNFINEVKSKIEEYSRLEPVVIAVAGNHDCDFPKPENKARESLIKLIENVGIDAVDDSVLDICLDVQKEFHIFNKSLNSNAFLKHSTKLFDIYEFKIDSKKIHFFCFNTAYMSILKENSHVGKMYMPYSLIPENYVNEYADLKIAVFHHPYNWLSPNNLRDFRTYIEDKFDLALTGHEHRSTKSMKTDLEGNFSYIIEGAVAQETGENLISGFNLLQFKLDEKQFLVNNFQWSKDYYKSEQKTPEWKHFLRGNVKITKPFELSAEFNIFLDDAGANFTHPSKSVLTLSDIFVYPMLRCIEYSQENENERLVTTISSETVLKEIKKDIRIFFTGAENCGKSALSKVCFRFIYNLGKIPILIDGYSIKSSNIEDFNKALNELFCDQYNKEDLDKFQQLSKDKIVLIIDDFEKSKLATKYKTKFLTNVSKFYTNILIFGNEVTAFEEILIKNADHSINPLPEFKNYEILEFGHLLRSQLINKWSCIGIGETFSDEDRIKKNNHAENIVSTIVGKNFVPNYPVFILTILQAVELGNPHDLQAGSFGHYYNYLITKSLQNYIKVDEFNTYFTYLSECANYMYVNKLEGLSIEDYEKFHEKYRKDYGFKLSISDVLKKLTSSSIFSYYNDIYEFKYLYIYYFFLGKFISDNIKDDETQTLIRTMCKTLFKRETANIFMFLSHHCKDDFLLDEILSLSKQLFSELEIVRLENDVDSINNLRDKIGKLVIGHIDVERNREMKHIAEDKNVEVSASNDDKNDELDKYDSIGDLDIISKINFAFKTIEILGQILKNNPGSIKANKKLQLAEEAYCIGLRTLNLFFSIFESSSEAIVNMIKDVISKQNKELEDRKIEEISKRVFFNICSTHCYQFVKKISDSVGSDKLSETFAEVLIKNNYNSIKLIDFSIKLDNNGEFPVAEMKKLKTQIESNRLSFTVLRKLVVNHLYMFPTNFQQRQTIFSTLNITMETQRLIEATTQTRVK